MSVLAAASTFRVSRSSAGGQSRIDQVVFFPLRGKGVAQTHRAILGCGKFDVCAGQVFRARQQRKGLDHGRQDHLLGGRQAHQDIVNGVARVVPLHTEPRSGVGLGVAVHQEDLEAFEGERRTEVNCGGGFAHATLLINDPDNFPHGSQD